jgi:2',3'-cyclic-nucleotide 2'-phosphodiesterase (5'-nucleotidase family)
MMMSRRAALARGALGSLAMAVWAGPGRSVGFPGNPARDEATSAPSRPGSKPSPAGRSGNGKLTLLQINDSHGYLDSHWEWFPGPQGPVYRKAGGYARMATLARHIQRQTDGGVLFLDNGDTFHGTRPVVQSRGEPLVPIMNELGLGAMTVHWDFAYGPRQLLRLRDGLNYPMLAINVYDEATGKAFLPPYTIKETGGLRVAVIGIASNIIDKTMPPHFSQGLRFTDGRKELPGIIDTVRAKEGARLVVVLSHLGFPQDMQLLSEVPGVDVLLSGHTHHRLFEPVRQGDTLVIQSGCHGSFLGKLSLEARDGRIVRHHHELIEVSEDIPPDPKIDAMVRDALASCGRESSEVVGETATGLHRNANLESTMDGFVLQAMREEAGTQLAFCNGWRWGAPIQAGKVTRGDLWNIIPWREAVDTVELTGRELAEMLEENLERTFSAQPFHQLGGYVKRCRGLTAYIKIENPPGTRIQKLFVGDQEAKPETIYTAAYLTVQAVPAKYGRNRRKLGTDIHDSMLKLLAREKPLRAEEEGRIVVV